METKKLRIIKAKLNKPNISLQEVKDLWFQAKDLLLNASHFIDQDIRISVGILNKVQEIVDDFFVKWREKKINPTDEELDTLEEILDEASWTFNFLFSGFSDEVRLPKSNEEFQSQVRIGRQMVANEKLARKEIKNIQSQINALQNQPNNDDNQAKISELQRQLDELKKRGQNSLPNFPQSNPPKKNDKDSSVKSFVFGFGVCLVLGLVIFIITNKKKRTKKKIP